MISEVIVICKLIQVNPVTSASAERSFSMKRRVKTWLQTNMNQNRFTNLALLKSHETRTDKLRLIDEANEFASVNENRKRNFATFTKADLIEDKVENFALYPGCLSINTLSKL